MATTNLSQRTLLLAEAFGWCLELWPEHRDCLTRLIQAFLRLGKQEQAIEMVEKCCSHSKDDDLCNKLLKGIEKQSSANQ